MAGNCSSNRTSTTLPRIAVITPGAGGLFMRKPVSSGPRRGPALPAGYLVEMNAEEHCPERDGIVSCERAGHQPSQRVEAALPGRVFRGRGLMLAEPRPVNDDTPPIKHARHLVGLECNPMAVRHDVQLGPGRRAPVDPAIKEGIVQRLDIDALMRGECHASDI